MLEVKQDTSSSLWSKMLEDQLSSRRDRIANMLIFGDPISGKRKLLDGLRKYTSQDASDRKKIDETDSKGSSNNVYLMDFKFLHLKELINDEIEEIGKINCFIFNRKYAFSQELMTKEMLQNLILILVADLETPETIEESLNSWFEYVSANVLPTYQSLDPAQLKELNQSYQTIIKKIKEIGRTNPEAAKKTETVEIIEEQNEEDHEEEPGNEKEEAPKVKAETGTVTAESIQIPIFIIGTKSERLEELSNNSLKEFTEYTLLKMAKKFNSTLFTISAFKDWNLDLLAQFILYSIFDKVPENQNNIVESTEIRSMFVRPESINMEEITKKYQQNIQYKFPKKKKEGDQNQVVEVTHEIRNINEFLGDVKNGIFNYGEESEASVFVNANSALGGYQTGQTGQTTGHGLFTKPTDRIRKMLKQDN